MAIGTTRFPRLHGGGGGVNQLFPDRRLFTESHLRDVKRYTLTPAFEFSPEAAIHGRALFGFEVFKPADPALVQRVGPVYELALNWSLYGRTVFDLSGGQNVNYSYLDSEPYYVLTYARLGVTQPVFGRLELYGVGDWEHLSYRWRRGGLDLPGPHRTDRFTVASGGVAVTLGPSFRVQVGIEKTRRRSIEDPRQNFKRTRVLSSVIVGS